MNMLVVEVTEIADGVWKVRTRQVEEDEGDSDWDALQCIADASAEDAFRRVETRDLLQTLLTETPLSRREREIINAFLEGDSLNAISKRLGLSKQNVSSTFRRVIKKLQAQARKLNIVP
jgi:RNA polymerase sigma factor (sigma-70 family)